MFLEGTGSIVFDHLGKRAYACRSERTNVGILQQVCNKLGYESGTVNKVQTRYPVASVRIGRCGDGDELTACTAGGNFLYSQNDKYCYPQDAVSITITCNERQFTANGNSSCNMGK